MRRADREITDIVEIGEILAACDVCRIGFGGEIPYIVPMNFGWEERDSRLTRCAVGVAADAHLAHRGRDETLDASTHRRALVGVEKARMHTNF